MVHYLRPNLLTRPDKTILNISSNDLQNKSENILPQAEVNLGKVIEKENIEIKLTFSSIIWRNDDAVLEEKVNRYNDLLVELFTVNKLGSYR